MQFIKVRSFLLAVIIGLAAMLVSLGVLGMMSPALAQKNDNKTDVSFEEANVQVTDLEGNDVGEAIHDGRISCNKNNCNQDTRLDWGGPPFTCPAGIYKFDTRQSVDPIARRVVVEGNGTLSSGREKERFSFTATIEDNLDGTLRVTYIASRPDASFIVSHSPGTMKLPGE